MAGIVLDTGVLIGLEKGSRQVQALLETARGRNLTPKIPTGVLAQYWRGGDGRQALVARFLRGWEVESLTEERAKQVGVLMRLSGLTDVVDCAVVALALEFGAAVATSDPGDITKIANAASGSLSIVQV